MPIGGLNIKWRSVLIGGQTQSTECRVDRTPSQSDYKLIVTPSICYSGPLTNQSRPFCISVC